MYYYKLCGEALLMALELEKENNDTGQRLSLYLMSEFGLEKDVPVLTEGGASNYVLFHGVKWDGETPSWARRVKGYPEYITPRLSTKRGKEISKKWQQFKKTHMTPELAKHLGIRMIQFEGLSAYCPRFSVGPGGCFLASAKRIKHADAVEVTFGDVEDGLAEIANADD